MNAHSILERLWRRVGVRLGFFLVEEARTEHRLWYDPVSPILELEADNRRLREALRQSLDELEDELRARYPSYLLEYPHNKSKFDGEMASINERRATLEDNGA